MRTISYITGLALLGGVLYLLVSLAGGPQASAGTDTQVVYICRETQELVSGPPQPTPAVNPRTRRRTLYRALYCPKCQIWRAVPPSQVSGGNPMSNMCPRHRQPMSPTGPLPHGATAR